MIQTKIAYWFVGLSRKKKAVILISMDAFFVLLAFWLSLSLRWGVWYVPTGDKWYLFAVAPFIAIPIFARLGLYRAIIRYIEIRALWVIVQATALYALAFAFVIYESDIKVIPRTVSPLNWVLIMLFVGSSRFCARCWLGEIYFRLGGSRINKAVGKKNVVIYGAGSAGAASCIRGMRTAPCAKQRFARL